MGGGRKQQEVERGGREVWEEVGVVVFFFKQKTAYEMCGRDWSSDVCSSDLRTYIRTKSGKLVERIVFMSEEDYNKFMEGGAAEVLKKYLSKDEVENLDSWDMEEVLLLRNISFSSLQILFPVE